MNEAVVVLNTSSSAPGIRSRAPEAHCRLSNIEDSSDDFSRIFLDDPEQLCF